MYLKNNSNKRLDFSNFAQKSFDWNGVNLSWRLVPVYLIIVGVFSFLLFNMFQLQIIEGQDYLLAASRTNQAEEVILPPRGLIYDANGQKLAYNLPSYTLYINPQQVNSSDENDTLKLVAKTFALDYKKIQKAYKEQAYSDEKLVGINRVTIKTGLSFEEYIDAVTTINQLDGVYLEVEPVREYPDAEYYAHILGYIGDPTEADVENGIYSQAQVGKLGIEKQYDQYLRGTPGIEITEKGVIDAREHTFTPLEAKYGDNVYLTIDADWQKKLTDIIANQVDEVGAFAGAGVIINSETGAVKAMVSYPSYDNSLFAQGISGSEYSKLTSDPKTPLLNRAIGLQLPPGSTFKIIGATAGLESGVINESTQFLSDRCMELPGDIKFCEADFAYLGNVDVKDALTKSSNIFFCNVALELNAGRGGIRTLAKYATAYGIGSKTGIDIPGEAAGTMATPELKDRLWGEPWYLGDECNAIIGQGLVTVTPLQMAVTAAAISNEGKVIRPHILDKVVDQTGEIKMTQEPEVLRKLDVSAETFRIIKEGMRSVVEIGTASLMADAQGEPIAKTGSADAAEIIQGTLYEGAHSWVVSCFDYKNENYCAVTMQQWGGRGYKTVPIMKKFINCVYNDFTSSCENV